jgi:uncharacterized protein
VKNITESPEKIDAEESDYLYVKESQIANAGKGLFTCLDIFENEIISVFKGEILSDFEAKQRAKNGLDGYFINMLNGSIMDSLNVECFAKYANDAGGLVKSNFTCNSFITLDDTENVCIVATRNIHVGEEIFCDYGRKYWGKRSS